MKRTLASAPAEWSLKLLVTVAVLWALWVQVLRDEDPTALWRAFHAQLGWHRLPYLLGCVLLMPLGWLLEAAKWRRLARAFMPMSWPTAVKAVLAGVSMAIFTPNRIGEYAGRILMVDAAYNFRAIVATFIGSFAQNIVLLSAGLAGALWFASNAFELPTHVAEAVTTLSLALIALLTLAYFHIDLIRPLARRLPWPLRIGRALQQLDVLSRYDAATLAGVLGLAALRYLVFSVQHVLMLWFYGIELSYLPVWASVATVFLLQMGVPLPPLVARGSIALFVWQHHTDNHLAVLAASYSIFVLNLALPALAGLMLILRANMRKSLGYD